MKKWVLILILSLPITLNAQIITTIGYGGYDPAQVTIDRYGTLYIGEGLGNRVIKIDTLGVRTIFAGTGYTGYSGDGRPATAADFNRPGAVITDTFGNVYICDGGNRRIRKVDIATGIVTTIAGTGSSAFSGAGIPATVASVDPTGLCFDKHGNLYVACLGNKRIRKIDTSGIITTVAGNGTYASTGDGGPATAAECGPDGNMCIDVIGNLYFVDVYTIIRKIDTSGIISTIAGDTSGAYTYTGDGVHALGAAMGPGAIAFDKNGLLTICDYENNRIRRIDSLGIIHTIAGNGIAGSTGDGGIADSAKLNGPGGIVYDTCGNLYIAQVNDGGIRKVTFNPFLTGLSGLSSVCQGSSITLTDSITGGAWSVSNSNASVTDSGVVTGIAAGTATISYSVSNSCGTVAATKVITISPLPNVGTISGEPDVCTGAVVTLTDTATGGAWSVSNGNASVASGMVTGIATGIDTISYSLTNACGANAAIFVITINTLPVAGTITGAGSLCIGTSDTLADSIAGGAWGISNTNASLTGSIVTGISAGIDTALYSVTNTCGTSIAIKIVTINPLPNAGIIMGVPSFCLGATDTLHDSIAGGSWSVGIPVLVTIDSVGILTSLATGTTTIIYTVTNSLCTAFTTTNITVSTIPFSGIITGADSVCAGSTLTLTDTASLGTTAWHSSDSLIATVAGGIVSGIAAGRDTIYYTVTNSCGTGTARKPITIKTTPAAGTITGADSVCMDAAITLSDSIAGGTWSCSNTNATNTGNVITGVSVGLDTIAYSLSNYCGTTTITKIIAIHTVLIPGTITGADSVCPGSVITLSDTTLWGMWSCNDTTNAAISATGVVTGINTATDTVIYTLSNSCGTSSTLYPVNILSLPDAGFISGPDSVCIGTSIVQLSTVPGGNWSCSNANATISGDTVTGAIAGLDTIRYSLTNSCTTATALHTIRILQRPYPGDILGLDSVCVGARVVLYDTVPGGVMSCTSCASLDTGNQLTGLIPGLDTVFYAVTNYCGTSRASKIVTINPLPDAGTITGIDSVCLHSRIILNDSIPAGAWSALNGNAMFIGDTLQGVTVGNDSIYYTVTNICGTAIARYWVRILSLPTAGTIISSSSNYCVGDSVTVHDTGAIGAGLWLAANTNARIVPPAVGVTNDMVVNISAGSDTIIYVATNSCGTDTAKQPIIIIDKPVKPIVSGHTIICISSGTSDTLLGSPPGGIWAVTNSHVTDSAGIITAISQGMDTVVYSVSNHCGTNVDSLVLTIPPRRACDTEGVAKIALPQNTIYIYPNPAHNELTITSGYSLTSITIRNLLGQKLLQATTNNNESNVDIERLPDGLFLIEIMDSEGKIVIRKFIKE